LRRIGSCGDKGKAQDAAMGSNWAASGSGVGDVRRGGLASWGGMAPFSESAYFPIVMKLAFFLLNSG
jgi:hypothetical protein